jgi:hypothetical protein
VRLTRHAKNELRRHKLTRSEVEGIVSATTFKDRDPEGRPRYLGYVRGTLYRIVVALDDPEMIVTIHPRRQR